MTLTFNSKHFIKEIQNRECLWNINVKEYTDKIARQCAWQELAEIMYKDWPDLEDKEKTAKVRDLQKKWKGLRDYFTRENNKVFTTKSDSGARRKRKTPYLDMLSFLSMKKKPKHAPQNHHSVEETNQETDSENRNSCCKPLKRYSVPATAQLASQDTTERQKDDPDWNFLLSILPDMKSMNPSQNFEFRFEVMSLIKNMKYNQHNTHYYYSTPGSSSFAHPVPEFKPSVDVDIDPISNESITSSPEDTKAILQSSPNSSPSK